MSARAPPALDLTHHFSPQSNALKPSPLSALQDDLAEYSARPGTLNFALGMPDPAYFPFDALAAAVLPAAAFPQAPPSALQRLWRMLASAAARITVPKHAAHAHGLDLAAALQYMPATGLPQLQAFTRAFTALVFRPAYADWATLVHVGNKEAIHRALGALCAPGERVLVEAWTYPSALACAQARGVLPAPVATDAQGMCSADLERVLAEWDAAARGAKRPHVLYTVPIGQNPTGATMGAARKKAIYAVCVKYDVVIIEDDPYYFLQEGPYTPKAQRSPAAPRPAAADAAADARFVASLAPSFVRFDYEGRVIRLDSFSKIMAPGARMGWFTCNPAFAQRLRLHGEAATQAPSGFAQALITQLVAAHWGARDFLRWLAGLQAQYTARRDAFVDAIFAAFDVRPAAAGRAGFTAYARAGALDPDPEKPRPRLFSFEPPSSGMFVWVTLHVADAAAEKGAAGAAGAAGERRLFRALAEHGLLTAPGHCFWAQQWLDGGDGGDGGVRLRLAFSMGTTAELAAGVRTLAAVLGPCV